MNIDKTKYLVEFSTIKDKNIAYHVTDDKKSVDENRVKLAKKFGYKNENLKYMDQIHTDIVKVVDENSLYRCDAIVTNKKEVPLMVMVADCIPMVFIDENKKAIGVAHAGRNGVFLNIASKTIKALKENYGSKEEDIKIILGPSIQKCCYEVSIELAHIVKKNFSLGFVNNRHIDLQGITHYQLLQNGVKEENIYISSICTKCSTQEYFSYRKDKNTGRFCAIAMIR